MTFEVLNLFFPVVLAIHNIDEYARYDEFVGAYHPRLPGRLRTRRVIGWAATLLTVVVAVLCVLTYLYPTPMLLLISKVAIFALLLNAVGHCVLSVIRRALLPGTRSACLLVLPYSAGAIFVMKTSLGNSFGTLVCYAGLGAVSAPLAIFAFLWMGYGLSSLGRTDKPVKGR